MKNYRIIWKSPSKKDEWKTVWFSSQDDADRMAESIHKEGNIVIRKEIKETKDIVS